MQDACFKLAQYPMTRTTWFLQLPIALRQSEDTEVQTGTHEITVLHCIEACPPKTSHNYFLSGLVNVVLPAGQINKLWLSD